MGTGHDEGAQGTRGPGPTEGWTQGWQSRAPNLGNRPWAPLPTWTPVTHCCRQRPRTWPKRLALALRTVLAWPKLLSRGSTVSSWVGGGDIQVSLGAAAPNEASQTRTVCGALLAHGGVDFPSPPCPAVGHAWGCPQGEARGLKTTLLAQRSGKVPLGPLGMASCPSPDTLSSFAPTPGCVGTAPSFWLPLSSQSRCAHCRREGLAGPPGRGT